MNILPLIGVLLLIFALYSSSISRDMIETVRSYATYRNYLKTSRLLDDELAKKAFAAAKSSLQKEKKEETDEEETDGRTSTYHCPRDQEAIVYNDSSKLNIAPLFQEEGSKKHPFLYEAALRLLSDLYGVLLTPASARELLNALLETPLQKEPISALLPKEHPLLPLLLKIAYGTGSYSLPKKEGYPPFAHFFRWDDPKPKSLCYFHLSKPVLQALFGPELSATIAKAEQEKWEEGEKGKKEHGLLLKELEPLITGKHAKFETKWLNEYFSFARKAKESKQIGLTDPKSGIRVEKPQATPAIRSE